MNRSTLSLGTLGLCALVSGVAVSYAALDYDTLAEKDRRESYFGMNGSKAFHIPDEIDGIVDERLDMMKELGVYWDRIDLWWHVVEPEQGEWDFSRPDLVFQNFEDHDVQWYPILCYGAAGWTGRNAPQNEEEFQRYGEYVYQTVSRYKDRATHWAVWNEPNIPNFWSPQPNPDHYARLLEIAYTRAKEADLDCVISAPVLAPLGEWDRDFTERLYQLGASDWFDVFDYHYYRNHPPELEIPAELAEIRAVMDRYGDGDKPIWISESGVTSPSQEGEEAYQKQAALVVRNQLLCFANGVERFFYFDLQNWYDDKPEMWDSQLGLVKASGERKPAFFAYQTMVENVDSRDVVGMASSAFADDVEAVLIYDPARKEYALAVWSTKEDESREIEITCEPRDVQVVEPFGEINTKPLEVPKAPGQRTRPVRLTIDRHPRFVRPVDASAYLPFAGVKLDPPMVIVAPDEEVELRISTSDLLRKPKTRVYTMNVPNGIEWKPKAGTLKLTGNLSEGEYNIEAGVEVDFGTGSGRAKVRVPLKAKVEVISTMGMVLRPVLVEDQLSVNVSITNQSKKSLEGDVELLSGSAIIAEGKSVPIGGGEARRLELIPEGTPWESIEDEAIWTLEYGGFVSDPFLVYTAKYSDEAPTVDGNLSDWAGVPILSVDKVDQITRNPEGWTKEEASAKARYWFTPDTIYFAAEVMDDDPIVNTNPAVEMWKGDAFELYIGLAGPTDRSVLDKKVDFQLGVAPTTNDGEAVAFWFHEDKAIEGAQIVTTKTDGGYNLEASIPVEVFAPEGYQFKPGMLLGLDVALDDYDNNDWAPAGNVPGRSLMWNGTGQNWINPSGWGMGVLKQMD